MGNGVTRTKLFKMGKSGGREQNRGVYAMEEKTEKGVKKVNDNVKGMA